MENREFLAAIFYILLLEKLSGFIRIFISSKDSAIIQLAVSIHFKKVGGSTTLNYKSNDVKTTLNFQYDCYFINIVQSCCNIIHFYV